MKKCNLSLEVSGEILGTINGQGTEELEVAQFNFGFGITTDTAKEILEKAGWTGATEEHLTNAQAKKLGISESPVIMLGRVYKIDPEYYPAPAYALIHSQRSSQVMDLHAAERTCPKDFWFLAVRTMVPTTQTVTG